MKMLQTTPATTRLTMLADENHAFQEWRYQATCQGRHIELRERAVVRQNAEHLLEEVRINFNRPSLLQQLGPVREE